MRPLSQSKAVRRSPYLIYYAIEDVGASNGVLEFGNRRCVEVRPSGVVSSLLTG